MNIIQQTHNGVPFLTCDGFQEAGGVAHGFSTRDGGVSQGMWASLNLGVSRGDDPDRVRENYRRFTAAIGCRPGPYAMNNQVHGDLVRVVTSADGKEDVYGRETWEADGLITDVPGIILTVFTADCIPVLLYDPVRRVTGAVHAGWRGTALGVVQRAVEKMGEVFACRPEDILAAIGPGIGQCCFETHEDVPNAMTTALRREALPYLKLLESGKYKVDLKGLNRQWLTRAGVAEEHIALCPACTACDTRQFWSHRVQGTQRGSLAAMIQLL